MKNKMELVEVKLQSPEDFAMEFEGLKADYEDFGPEGFYAVPFRTFERDYPLFTNEIIKTFLRDMEILTDKELNDPTVFEEYWQTGDLITPEDWPALFDGAERLLTFRKDKGIQWEKIYKSHYKPTDESLTERYGGSYYVQDEDDDMVKSFGSEKAAINYAKKLAKKDGCEYSVVFWDDDDSTFIGKYGPKDESLTEDLRNDVFNALEDVAFDYAVMKDDPKDREEFEDAENYFNAKFFIDGEDFEEALNENYFSELDIKQKKAYIQEIIDDAAAKLPAQYRGKVKYQISDKYFEKNDNGCLVYMMTTGISEQAPWELQKHASDFPDICFYEEPANVLVKEFQSRHWKNNGVNYEKEPTGNKVTLKTKNESKAFREMQVEAGCFFFNGGWDTDAINQHNNEKADAWGKRDTSYDKNKADRQREINDANRGADTDNNRRSAAKDPGNIMARQDAARQAEINAASRNESLSDVEKLDSFLGIDEVKEELNEEAVELTPEQEEAIKAVCDELVANADREVLEYIIEDPYSDDGLFGMDALYDDPVIDELMDEHEGLVFNYIINYLKDYLNK